MRKMECLISAWDECVVTQSKTGARVICQPYQ